jgi:hypothetical protein
MPRTELCARLNAVYAHETDDNFRLFLESMLQRYCAQ